MRKGVKAIAELSWQLSGISSHTSQWVIWPVQSGTRSAKVAHGGTQVCEGRTPSRGIVWRTCCAEDKRIDTLPEIMRSIPESPAAGFGASAAATSIFALARHNARLFFKRAGKWVPGLSPGFQKFGNARRGFFLCFVFDCHETPVTRLGESLPYALDFASGSACYFFKSSGSSVSRPSIS